MTKGSRRFRPFDKRSRLPPDDRHYLDGDWKLGDLIRVLGLVTRNRRSLIEGVNHECKGDECSVSSFSTNATMDNNIGPGRMLDKLYQYFGRKVEWGILHISVSSLHPNRIMHCLCVDEIHDDDDAQSDSDYDTDSDSDFDWLPSPSQPPPIQSQAIESIQVSEVIARIYDQRGSAAVAGLKSLVHQMQSKSAYKSVAAFIALLRLSISSELFLEFLYTVVNKDFLLQLKVQCTTLDDSNPDKWLFLSLVSIVDTFLKLAEGLGRCKTAHCLRKDLIQAMDQDQTINYKSLYALAYTCSLLIEVWATTADTNETSAVSTMDCLGKTAYFLFMHFLFHLNHALLCIDSRQQLAYLILNVCINVFNNVSHNLLLLMIQRGWNISHPFLAYGEKIPQHKFLLRAIFRTSKSCIPKNQHPYSLPRNHKAILWSPDTDSFRSAIAFARQLHTYPLHDLRTVVEDDRAKFRDCSSFFRKGLIDSLRKNIWSKEDLRRTHEHAMRVEVLRSDLTCEFLKARDRPHGTFGENQNFSEWKCYKENCYRRRIYGECLWSNMDWDWNTGTCLRNLFKLEESSHQSLHKAAPGAALYGYGSRGETAQLALEDARARLPKEIRVRYEDEKGRIRYKTFLAHPSTESITASLVVSPEPSAEPSRREEIESDKEPDDADVPSIYESALEFPLD